MDRPASFRVVSLAWRTFQVAPTTISAPVSATMKRVQIINNLFENLDSKKFGADGRFITISGGEDITVAGNTIFHDGNVITAHGDASKRFIFRNNIVSFNNYGFNGGNGESMKELFPKYFPGGLISDNVFVHQVVLAGSW